jgi:hypothetical protein
LSLEDIAVAVRWSKSALPPEAIRCQADQAARTPTQIIHTMELNRCCKHEAIPRSPLPEESYLLAEIDLKPSFIGWEHWHVTNILLVSFCTFSRDL